MKVLIYANRKLVGGLTANGTITAEGAEVQELLAKATSKGLFLRHESEKAGTFTATREPITAEHPLFWLALVEELRSRGYDVQFEDLDNQLRSALGRAKGTIPDRIYNDLERVMREGSTLEKSYVLRALTQTLAHAK